MRKADIPQTTPTLPFAGSNSIGSHAPSKQSLGAQCLVPTAAALGRLSWGTFLKSCVSDTRPLRIMTQKKLAQPSPAGPE